MTCVWLLVALLCLSAVYFALYTIFTYYSSISFKCFNMKFLYFGVLVALIVCAVEPGKAGADSGKHNIQSNMALVDHICNHSFLLHCRHATLQYILWLLKQWPAHVYLHTWMWLLQGKQGESSKDLSQFAYYRRFYYITSWEAVSGGIEGRYEKTEREIEWDETEAEGEDEEYRRTD